MRKHDPVKSKAALDALLAEANMKIPCLASRVYICLSSPVTWINRLALGRVLLLIHRAGGNWEPEHFLRAVLDLSWSSQYKRCPVRRFKLWHRVWVTRRRKRTDAELFALRRHMAFEKLRLRFREYANGPYNYERRTQLYRHHDMLSKVNGPKGWAAIYCKKYS